VICAIAPNSVILIVGRAVAGIGAAGLFSGSMTIVGYAAPLKSRAIYLAAIASMFGISSIVGPILGGIFTEKLSWRWCFWINLPFGFLGILIVLFFFKNPVRGHVQKSLWQKFMDMDPVGATFLIGAIVCLLLALQWGGLEKPWINSTVWGCLLGFTLLLLIFVIIQVRLGDKATIPGRVLKQRSILATALTLFFMSMGLYV
jgi:MFS family permease